MKKCLYLLALAVCACSNPSRSAQSPAELLASRLKVFVSEGKTAYGHQDDLAYGHDWLVADWTTDDLERSDVRDVSGSFPMVVGFDLGGIEKGDSCNLDGVPFGLIRKAARKHVERGGIITFSWHLRNIVTGGDSWDVSERGAVAACLEGGSRHDEFMVWLRRLGDFIESLGLDVPCIFRPWHENLGSWFWWGRDLCSEDEYIRLFGLTRSYFDSRGLDNVLWCYSPNGDAGEEAYMSRYPGDDVVDILGVDTYESLYGGRTLAEGSDSFKAEVRDNLGYLSRLADAHGKMLCFSETGLEGIPDATWWTQTLLPAIEGFPIAYVLTWRNAHDRQEHFFAPWKGFENADDFKEFSENDKIVLLNGF